MTSPKSVLAEHKWLWLSCGLAGVLVGLALYTAYVSRVWSYAGNEPGTCVNCHIMGSYFEAWAKSSHRNAATCNDCHVPQDNFIRKYTFKAVDGLYHATVFTVRGERQTIRPRHASNEVIIQNCVRCHTQLVTEFAKMYGDYRDVTEGNAKACWDCHTQVPHGGISNIGSAILAAAVPQPGSNVPVWMKDLLNNSGR